MTNNKKNTATTKKPDTKKKNVKKGSIHDPDVIGTVHNKVDTKDFTPSAFFHSK